MIRPKSPRWSQEQLDALRRTRNASLPSASPAIKAAAVRKRGKPAPHDFVADLIFQIKTCGLPLPTREYAFAKPRRWRFDCAYILEKIAVEVEGAIWTEGRHTRGSGFVADIEKYNEATLRGWRLLRVTTDQVTSGVALNLVDRAWLEFKPA